MYADLPTTPHKKIASLGMKNSKFGVINSNL
jgi:hypothetical protein